MCIVFLSVRSHAGTKVVLCVNRDEFLERPTREPSFWESPDDYIVGARDLEKGGTQCAVTKSGRFAVITNCRVNPEQLFKGSRGMIAVDYLRSSTNPGDFLHELAKHGNDYDGFNILLGTPEEVWYYGNQSQEPPTKLKPGVYGLSNAFLNTPWPKVCAGKRKLSAVTNVVENYQLLFDLLNDQTPAHPDELQKTAFDPGVEEKMSAIFVKPFQWKGEHLFGTRSQHIFIIDNENNAYFWSNYLQNSSKAWVPTAFQFRIDNTQVAVPGESKN